MSERIYTTKQMGDAGEMPVAAELTLHGIPALKVPDNWPHYDIIAQPPDNWSGYRTDARPPQTISVKTRTFARSGNFVGYGNHDKFDSLAIVILPDPGLNARRIFIVPCRVAHERSYQADYRGGRGFFVHRLVHPPPSPFPRGEPVLGGGWGLADYENNFGLSEEPTNMPVHWGMDSS
jgi:hypothetical protein